MHFLNRWNSKEPKNAKILDPEDTKHSMKEHLEINNGWMNEWMNEWIDKSSKKQNIKSAGEITKVK